MRRLLNYLSLIVLTTAASGVAARQAPVRSPRIANYTIEAALDPAGRRLQGTGRLEWRNATSTPATELRFHLYWNAWRDDGSTWMRSRTLAGDTSLQDRSDADRGYTDLTALRLVRASGPVDLLPRVEYIAPDDGNSRDRTLISVPLDEPLMPGHDVTIEFAWTAQVPRTYDRTGYIGDTYFIAQWFPKIGVLEEDGWKARQFFSHAEFFADFGHYDVRLTVPTGWIVGATGRESALEAHANGTTTHRYTANDVHDFAWTTSPDYVERRETFSEPGLTPVEIRLLLQPGHVTQADRHFTAAKAALKYYGQWFAPYPWEQLTIVDPVTLFNPSVQGGPSGGMEYPTLITAGTQWATTWIDKEPETVIVHEVGHQFWHSVVATNETDHGWMDEGLNTFTSAKVLAQAYPNRFVAVERYFGGLVSWPYLDVRWNRLVDVFGLDRYRSGPGWDAPESPTWAQAPQTSAATTYGRVSLGLEMLERLLGPDTVRDILATHYARGAFRHPTPAEFYSIANSVSGRDLSWFFDATFRSAAGFDYGIGAVSSTQLDADTVANTITLRRFDEGVFPVEVLVKFEDGTSVMERWAGREPWRTFTYDRPSAVSIVEIDPERILALDLNRTNNSWTKSPRNGQAADKWALRWAAWFQHLLMSYAFFA